MKIMAATEHAIYNIKIRKLSTIVYIKFKCIGGCGGMFDTTGISGIYDVL